MLPQVRIGDFDPCLHFVAGKAGCAGETNHVADGTMKLDNAAAPTFPCRPSTFCVTSPLMQPGCLQGGKRPMPPLGRGLVHAQPAEIAPRPIAPAGRLDSRRNSFCRIGFYAATHRSRRGKQPTRWQY